MVALEGDCTINKYTDKEGRARSDLSIVQREYSLLNDGPCCVGTRGLTLLGSIEILDKRAIEGSELAGDSRAAASA